MQRKSLKILFPAAVCAIFLSAPHRALSVETEPWYAQPFLKTNKSDLKNNFSPASSPLAGLIKFFQKLISPADGPTCGFRPTCSEYALKAIKCRGPILGSILTAERLLRDHSPNDSGLYDTVLENKIIFAFDPPKDNLLGCRGDE